MTKNDQLAAGLRRSTDYVRSLSEEQLLAMVPLQSGIYFTDCPHCDAGAQDRSDWEWSPQHPTRIRCRGCGEVYPDNQTYPDREQITVAGPDGPQHYPYYAGADGYRIFFRAHADYLARQYLAVACRDLARLYATGSDEVAARRSALLLHRFAQVYPGYAVKFDYPFRQKRFSPYSRPIIEGVPAYRSSKWSWWAYLGISRELLEAYDLLRDWPGWADLGADKALERVETDLLGGMVQFVMSVPESYTNMSPGMWRDFITAGRVMHRSEWVAEALDRVSSFLESGFLYDGFWKETSPSYCSQVLGALQSVAGALKGYESPPGAAADLAANISTGVENLQHAVATLAAALAAMRMPDGGMPTINDTWAGKGNVRAESASVLLPGLGFAMLAGGRGKGQVAAWLNYTGGVGHKHADALSIALFAHGRELLRDIGYTHTAWRSWSTCSMSHNTVVVNGVNSAHDPEHRGNRLRCFAGAGNGFHVAEAESATAYAAVTRRYRRTLMLVGAAAGDAYLLDLFQVEGGTRHDYLLHGTAAEDSTLELPTLAMRPYDGSLLNPGVEFQYPKGESFGYGAALGYGFVRDLRVGIPQANVDVDMRMTEAPSLGVRTILAQVPGMTVYAGQAPRLRQAERNDSRLKDFNAPFFCARVDGEDLSTVFAAVHEPVSGSPAVRDLVVHREDKAVVLQIDRGAAGRDYAVIGVEDEDVQVSRETPDGRLEFAGRWGLVRVDAEGRCRAMHLVSGTRLRLAEIELLAEGDQRGIVTAVSRQGQESAGGWFEVGAALDATVAGSLLLCTFADGTVRGYSILRAVPSGQGSRLHVKEDPGCEMTAAGVHLRGYPERSLGVGQIAYRILGVSHLRPAR